MTAAAEHVVEFSRAVWDMFDREEPSASLSPEMVARLDAAIEQASTVAPDDRMVRLIREERRKRRDEPASLSSALIVAGQLVAAVEQDEKWESLTDVLPNVRQAAVIRPGDSLVVRCQSGLTVEQAYAAQRMLRERLPGVNIVVLGAEDMAVARGGEGGS